MVGFQYSWYGAGFIDWMLRGPNGDYVFIHRMRNNNKNTEAFMRSGNLPVRYEVINEGPYSRIGADIDDAAGTLTLEDASLFPTDGTLYIDNELLIILERLAINSLVYLEQQPLLTLQMDLLDHIPQCSCSTQ